MNFSLAYYAHLRHSFYTVMCQLVYFSSSRDANDFCPVARKTTEVTLLLPYRALTSFWSTNKFLSVFFSSSNIDTQSLKVSLSQNYHPIYYFTNELRKSLVCVYVRMIAMSLTVLKKKNNMCKLNIVLIEGSWWY